MKKFLIIYILALILGGSISMCSNKEKEVPSVLEIPSYGVEVDWRLGDLFDRFNLLMEQNDIEIDYTKLERIVVLPLDRQFNGLYWEETIYININLSVPNGTTLQVERDFVLYVLAHEIGHSQGMAHTPQNPFNLMYNGGEFAISNIKAKSIEEIILNAYCNKVVTPTR